MSASEIGCSVGRRPVSSEPVEGHRGRRPGAEAPSRSARRAARARRPARSSSCRRCTRAAALDGDEQDPPVAQLRRPHCGRCGGSARDRRTTHARGRPACRARRAAGRRRSRSAIPLQFGVSVSRISTVVPSGASAVRCGAWPPRETSTAPPGRNRNRAGVQNLRDGPRDDAVRASAAGTTGSRRRRRRSRPGSPAPRPRCRASCVP